MERRARANREGSGHGVEAAQLAPPTPRTRARLFRTIDASGNGTLSMSEVATAITELWPTFDNSNAIRQAFRAADEDGSAVIGHEEFGRFMECVSGWRAIRISVHALVAARLAVAL